MEFVLWACRLMHVVSVVVWVGGLIFLNAILLPVAEHEGAAKAAVILGAQKRFLPFIWSSLWTLLATGFFLMLGNPHFVWFDISTPWLKLLALKQIIFLLLSFFSWQTAVVLRKMEDLAGGDAETVDGWRLSFRKLVRRAILWSIISLMCAVGMVVV